MPSLPKSKKRPWVKDSTKHERMYSNSKFYNSGVWRRLRNRFIKENPICKSCHIKGIITAGNCVDHIIPLRLGGMNLWENLQTLCNPCHNKKSGQEGAEYRKGIKIKNK